jgi:hypothetical protein
VPPLAGARRQGHKLGRALRVVFCATCGTASGPSELTARWVSAPLSRSNVTLQPAHHRNAPAGMPPGGAGAAARPSGLPACCSGRDAVSQYLLLRLATGWQTIVVAPSPVAACDVEGASSWTGRACRVAGVELGPRVRQPHAVLSWPNQPSPRSNAYRGTDNSSQSCGECRLGLPQPHTRPLVGVGIDELDARLL